MENKNVGDTRYIPTVLSFCAGYGGIERGLDLAGVEHRVLAYVEIEAFATANLVAKMEDGSLDPAPIYTDLKTFPAGLFRGAVDIITGGYPCQPFSAAGRRLGSEDPRHLWPYISEAVRIIRPGRVFFENVEGHISLGLNEVVSDLEDRGYDTTWGIFSAAEVGAPHQRKRVYIMADAQSQRHGQGGGERNLHEEDGGQVGQSRPITTGSGEQPEYLADTGHAGLQGAAGCGGAGAERRSGRYATKCSSEMADPVSPRSEAGVSGQERPNEEREPEVINHRGDRQGRRPDYVPDTGCRGGEGAWGDQCFWPFTAGWCPEPNVGRVVDGGADRVDRIRLLGNGVVPQTAAKAWMVLDDELSAPDCGSWEEFTRFFA